MSRASLAAGATTMDGRIMAALAACVAAAVGCGTAGRGTSSAGPGAGGGDEGGIVVGPVENLPDAGWSTIEQDSGPFVPVSPPDAAAKPQADAGGYLLCDGGVMPADHFVTQLVSYDAGPCAGFGQTEMPGIVEGPPVGGGAGMGSLDVLSLGNGGSLVVAFTPNQIVDGPGIDFIVFENPFDIAGNPNNLYAEPGEVSVSNDGVNWTTFPCTSTTFPYGACGGWHVVYSNPANCISPFDTTNAGGDAYDLADIGVTSAKYVRIVDKIIEACPATAADDPNTNGFDLDAIAIVNGANAD
ncbi:MAG: cell surface protein [Polyangiaceae bacterium]